jgi:uncharacterized protein YifE (UPF0438 family)
MKLEIPSDLSALKSNLNQDHFWFAINALSTGGATPAPVSGLKVKMGGMAFEVRIDDQAVLFHFTDWRNLPIIGEVSSYAACFKFHYDPSILYGNGWHPFSPISFLDWREYRRLRSLVRYNASGRFIGNRQIARGKALHRRTAVREALLNRYGKAVLSEEIEQRQFWQEINDLLVSVCVPGARNDILDRGQIQYMALGGCTISPKLAIDLPWAGILEPGRHYLECAADYHDLIPLVEWCENHREECAAIGANAKNLFEKTLTGDRLRKWVLEVIHRG